jgi:hypothetical protein
MLVDQVKADEVGGLVLGWGQGGKGDLVEEMVKVEEDEADLAVEEAGLGEG